MLTNAATSVSLTLDNERSNIKTDVKKAKEMVKSNNDHSYTLSIPNNILIEQLLSEYPLDIPHAKDYLIYIMHLIYGIPAFKKDTAIKNDSGYTNLHSTFLQNRVKQYPIVVDWLLARGIFETDGHYIKGKKPIGYRFTKDYRVEHKDVLITCKTLIKSIRTKRYKDTSILKPENLPDFDITTDNRKGVTYSQLAEERLSYLRKWFNPMLQIDFNTAKQFLQNLLDQNKDNVLAEQLTHNVNCWKLVLNSFNNPDVRFYVDETAGRLHTSLTNLKSSLRAFITYSDQVLISVDIRNSQPLLSLALLDYCLFDRNRMLERISLYNNKFRKGSSTSPSSLGTILVNFIREHSQSGDVLHYRELVLSGKLYDHFGLILKEKGIIDGEVTELRNAAKKEVFAAIFSHNNSINLKKSQGLRIFKATFPNVYEVFRIIKMGEHRTLACILQNLEAETVLHSACKDIALTNSDIPLFTIHDSIVTTKEHIDIVTKKLSEHVYAVINANPAIKIEKWDKSLLDKEQPINVAKKDDRNRVWCPYGYVDDNPVFFMCDQLTIPIKEAAKMLGIGPNKLRAGLRYIGILGDGKNARWNMPNDYCIDNELFSVRTSTYSGHRNLVLSVADNGVNYLREVIGQYPDLFA